MLAYQFSYPVIFLAHCPEKRNQMSALDFLLLLGNLEMVITPSLQEVLKILSLGEFSLLTVLKCILYDQISTDWVLSHH